MAMRLVTAEKVTCPWCGAEMRPDMVEYEYCAAECPECGAQGPRVLTTEEVTEGSLKQDYARAMARARIRMQEYQEARVIPREEYDAWDADAWIEDQESGQVVALDRTAVPAYVKYIRFDHIDPKRLWTSRPGEAQRRETPW